MRYEAKKCIRLKCKLSQEKKQKNQCIYDICYIKDCLLSLRLILRCAYSCVSSNHESFCKRSYIDYRETVFRRCVKACDTLDRLSDCKSRCTAYKNKAFCQYV